MQYPSTPQRLAGILEYIKQHYNNPLIYIHENGVVYLSLYSHDNIFKLLYRNFIGEDHPYWFFNYSEVWCPILWIYVW